jgi:hypothetical protein
MLPLVNAFGFSKKKWVGCGLLWIGCGKSDEVLSVSGFH